MTDEITTHYEQYLLRKARRYYQATRRVRDLHRRTDLGLCFACGQQWPCPTLHAIDDEDN